ncbi:T9SS type A sorting domain-containing protein [Saprospira sp. CCB-QB6]|uniref:T9SS type A sorting domain-containing protein n=1 Tax=Saprospira sp. CCB-QB6 TaxID=3023936 RepID=UPI00234B5373|nr:T9SS type A sorting domain-containing protein [Saprospira sp. CCB-QB6]WCL82619.1 T9SS type A sorting domain-containing protein [Saprospira sp. CCB-QB6]
MRSLLLFLALFTFCSVAKAQQADTAAWCPSGATWVYSVSAWGPDSYLKYTYEKDTLLLNQAVKKIAVSRVHYIGPNVGQGRSESQIGYEYEYMSNDRLYFYDSSSNSFILKFDFNAVQGDSLIVRNPRSTCDSLPNFPDQDTLYIDSLSQDTFNQLIFDRYHLSSGSFESFRFDPVIKYIGSFESFHPEVSETNCPLPIDGYIHKQLFFYQDSLRGRVVFSENYNDTLVESIISSIFRTESGISAAKEVRVFPNPAQDELWLDVALNGVLNLSIYNLAGQEVRHFQLHQNHFSIRDLPKGMYILHLRTDDQQFYPTKFVKQ